MRVPDTQCPHCLHKIDGATNIDDESLLPKPGDFTVCLYCAAVAIVGEDRQLRKMTKDEREEAAKNKQVIAMAILAKKRLNAERATNN